MLGRYLVSVAFADIAAQAHVEAGVLQQVVDERGGGGFAVGSGDANLLCAVVAARKFNLGHHADAFFADFLHHGYGTRDAGALDHLIRIEDEFLRVLPLFEGNLPLPELCGIRFLDLPLVAQEHIESFYFCQNSGSDATLCTS